jgi:hypothetical protein
MESGWLRKYQSQVGELAAEFQSPDVSVATKNSTGARWGYTWVATKNLHGECMAVQSPGHVATKMRVHGARAYLMHCMRATIALCRSSAMRESGYDNIQKWAGIEGYKKLRKGYEKRVSLANPECLSFSHPSGGYEKCIRGLSAGGAVTLSLGG